MTNNQVIELEYPALIAAAKKVTGGHQLHMDLLHHSIEELYNKPNSSDIIQSGGLRFYLVRIMCVQWRSKTGPFYKQFGDHYSREVPDSLTETETEPLDTQRVSKLLHQLPWYDRMLFEAFTEGDHTYSSLARATGIPRTSISLTIRRVREYLKQNLFT